ncbi:MAG: bifunctional diaminohydroxyphosphoribosylaminopyrimidine deaminase/5-amino-6-(5-phosphoribosylamino)uracil reductase RibD [Paludibacteraceae bacterium]|nr:bifunctional diaminohydroxyphosphoribosylaminopyrimidine deaminase/5-amino-6-(5-phosphoribosylamino)uracil reductase RibD [Paludibacteraceae bacterium]
MVEEKYMQRCFELAQRGIGNAAPNPMVGAVIVCDGKIIGEGYHRKCGEAHAEVNAVASVKNPELLKRSVMYVSLEPCSHYGKTPPCANLILEKGIPEVVVANVDPFPEVSGRGIRLLREHGVKVTEGVMAEQGWELNRRFFTFHTKKRPYVILKWAQSADGYMDAYRDSAVVTPLRISNTQTSLLSHKLRAEESAIMVGTRTAILDNPSLTVRNWSGRNPVRILLDRALRVPQNYKLYDGQARTIVLSGSDPISPHPMVEYHKVKFDANGKAELSSLLEVLYQLQLQSVIVEGGAAMHRSFIEANLWDEMRVEINTQLMVKNGVEAPTALGTLVEEHDFNGHLLQVRRNF